MQTEVLSSWKEIAHFLDKGVRTVQRWECEFNLPVHRPTGTPRGTVNALPDELIEWANGHSSNSSVNPVLCEDQMVRMRTATAFLVEQRALLVEQRKTLRMNLERVKTSCCRAVALTGQDRARYGASGFSFHRDGSGAKIHSLPE